MTTGEAVTGRAASHVYRPSGCLMAHSLELGKSVVFDVY